MQTLVKVHRLAGFFLVRVMRSKKPCLVRSCILLEHAVRRGLDAVVHVGVSKQGQNIDGHAWVTIGGVPFFESQETLDAYTVMWKG
ncbi:MAG: lasso peptide biosynthesis B2 protein, partial [Clostridia bacterium]